jgi:hypothetical protein
MHFLQCRDSRCSGQHLERSPVGIANQDPRLPSTRLDEQHHARPCALPNTSPSGDGEECGPALRDAGELEYALGATAREQSPLRARRGARRFRARERTPDNAAGASSRSIPGAIVVRRIEAIGRLESVRPRPRRFEAIIPTEADPDACGVARQASCRSLYCRACRSILLSMHSVNSTLAMSPLLTRSHHRQQARLSGPTWG